jgi:hypothetical protein
MKIVRIFGNDLEAQVARTKLESEGIPAFVSSDDCGGTEPFLQLTNGVRLMVNDEDIEQSQRILADAQR